APPATATPPAAAAARLRHLAAVVAAALRARAEALRVRRAVAGAVLAQIADACLARHVANGHVRRAEHAREHRAHQHARRDAEQRRVIAGVRAVAHRLVLRGAFAGRLAL